MIQQPDNRTQQQHADTMILPPFSININGRYNLRLHTDINWDTWRRWPIAHAVSPNIADSATGAFT